MTSPIVGNLTVNVIPEFLLRIFARQEYPGS